MTSLSSLKKSTTRPLRSYEGIWLELREKQVAVIELIDSGFLRRVKKMIIKEKCADLGFKLLNDVERYHLRFSWCEEKKQLTIRLVSRFGLMEVE